MKKSELIKLEKTINILTVIKLFLENESKITIPELSAKTGFSTSCIQRYLNDPIIEKILGKEAKEEIKEKLSSNLDEGRKLGGENYALRNTVVRTANGRYNGSVRKKLVP